MAWMDPLTANLLDLIFELREHPVPLTIGGGFGLYLKRRRLEETRERTLFSELPMPRATNDLDLFIRAEVLCDFQSMTEVAAALNRLDRKPGLFQRLRRSKDLKRLHFEYEYKSRPRGSRCETSWGQNTGASSAVCETQIFLVGRRQNFNRAATKVGRVSDPTRSGQSPELHRCAHGGAHDTA